MWYLVKASDSGKNIFKKFLKSHYLVIKKFNLFTLFKRESKFQLNHFSKKEPQSFINMTLLIFDITF